MELTKELARQLQKGSYVPNGRQLSREEFRELVFRRTRSNEVYQCSVRTNPHEEHHLAFCGIVAEYVADHNGCIVALCEQHAPPFPQE